MGLRWFHTSEVWRMGQRLCAYSRISSTLAMLYDVSSGVSESDMLLKCDPRITQSPLSIASLMRFFICVLVSQPRESDFKRQSLQTVSVVVGIVVDKVVGGSHGTFKKLFHDGHIVGELC